jgi:nitronate monooxygenase
MPTSMSRIRDRTGNFCRRFELRAPILLAPMAGVPAPELSAAVARAGGMGACGVLLMSPAEIGAWATQVRSLGGSAFQLNNWIPDPPPDRDHGHEADVRAFLSAWGPPVPAHAGDAQRPEFDLQCEAMLAADPPVVSSIMGLFPAPFIRNLKQRGIAWFANVSTVAEARAAEAAGADVIVAQGMEAGGHRASFEAREAERRQVGLMALLPAVVDAVRLPVAAAGGIADARGLAAALLLGASAVQIGTGFLRSPEARIPAAWAEALAHSAPEDTVVSRVFSGRAGRSIATDYVRAATAAAAPHPAPYPVQRGLTAAMRTAAAVANDVHRMQAWAGQAAALARAEPAAQIVGQLWQGARELLGE